MASLTACLNRHGKGLSDIEKTRLLDMVEGFTTSKKYKYDIDKASKVAVDNTISELETERADILSEAASKGWKKVEIPELTPELIEKFRTPPKAPPKTVTEAAVRPATTGEKRALEFFTDTIELPSIVAQPIKDLKSVIPKMKTVELETLIDSVDAYVEHHPGSMKGVLKKKYDAMKKEVAGRPDAGGTEPVKITKVEPTITEDMSPTLVKILEEDKVPTRRSILRKKEKAPEAGATWVKEHPPIRVEDLEKTLAERKSSTTPVGAGGSVDLVESLAEKAKGKAAVTITPEMIAKKYDLEYRGATDTGVVDGKLVGDKWVEDPSGRTIVVFEFFDPQTGKSFVSNTLNSVKTELKVLREDTSKKPLVETVGETEELPGKTTYNGKNMQEWHALAMKWYEGDSTIDINQWRRDFSKWLNKLNENERLTNSDIADLRDRGDELLGIVKKAMDKRGLIPKDEETIIDEAISANKALREQKRMFDEAHAKATAGDIKEPKSLTKEERMRLIKQAHQRVQERVLRDGEATRSIEEGENLSKKLPEEYRGTYEKAFKDQLDAVDGSEQRSIGEIINDISTITGGEEGAIGGRRIKISSPEVRLALQRLQADALRLGKDLTEVLRRNGFTEVEIAMLKRALDQMRKGEPQDSTKPRNTGVLYDAQGDPIVKQRKVGGVDKIPVRLSEVKMMEDAPNLPSDRWGWAKPTIRTFEKYGNEIKEAFYYDYRQREINIRKRLEEFREQAKAIRGDLSNKERGRIGAYGYAQQPKGAALLKASGIDIPTTLTDRELSAYRRLREAYKGLFGKINEVRKLIGKEPLEEIDNYQPFVRTFRMLEKMGITTNPLLDDPAAIASKYAKSSQYPFKYSKLRKKTGTYPIELDPFTIFEDYTQSAIRHMELSPLIAKIRELANTNLPNLKTGKMDWNAKTENPGLHNFLMDWASFLSGQPSIRLPRVFEKPLAMLNNNLAFSILGANVRSALIQVTALRNTLTEVGAKYTIKGIEDLASGEYKAAMEESLVLPTRAYDVVIDDFMNKVRQGRAGEMTKGIGRAAMWPLSALDAVTARITWNAGYEYAIHELHLSGKRAINFADDVVVRTQASALPGDLAPIQRSTVGKALTMFQTFVLNDWQFLAKDVLGLGERKLLDPITTKKVFNYVMATTFFNIIYEDLMGVKSPFPTPINEYMLSREEGEGALATGFNVAKELIEPIPLIGSARYGKTPLGPTAELLAELYKKTTDQPMQKPWAEIGGKVAGVPGTTQVGKFRRARQRGEGYWGSLVGTYRPPKKSKSLKGLEGPSELGGP